MTADADVVFFMQGGHAVTARYAIKHMRERGAKVGLVRLRTIRPYPTDRVKEVAQQVQGSRRGGNQHGTRQRQQRWLALRRSLRRAL